MLFLSQGGALSRRIYRLILQGLARGLARLGGGGGFESGFLGCGLGGCCGGTGRGGRLCVARRCRGRGGSLATDVVVDVAVGKLVGTEALVVHTSVGAPARSPADGIRLAVFIPIGVEDLIAVEV